MGHRLVGGGEALNFILEFRTGSGLDAIVGHRPALHPGGKGTALTGRSGQRGERLRFLRPFMDGGNIGSGTDIDLRQIAYSDRSTREW